MTSPSLVEAGVSARVDADAASACEQVSAIKALPLKDDSVVEDPAYRALMAAGPAAIPCLIEKVGETTPMHDPRGIPGPTDTRVGDVAYFMIVRIARLEFTEMLPEYVRDEYEEQGVYAYHAFVANTENRAWLQARLRNWYRQSDRSERQ